MSAIDDIGRLLAKTATEVHRKIIGGIMREKTLAAAECEVERPYLRAALLCGLVLFLEGYDIAAVGYAIPSLVDVWRVDPSAFTGALVAGNVGLVLGSTGAGLLGDRAGRRPVRSAA
jgi:hypothetical protein